MIHYVCIRNEDTWNALLKDAAKECRNPSQQGEYLITCALNRRYQEEAKVPEVEKSRRYPWSLNFPQAKIALHKLGHYVNDKVAAGVMCVTPAEVATDTGINSHWITQSFSVLEVRKDRPRTAAGEQGWVYDLSTWKHTEDVGSKVSGVSCSESCTITKEAGL